MFHHQSQPKFDIEAQIWYNREAFSKKARGELK